MLELILISANALVLLYAVTLLVMIVAGFTSERCGTIALALIYPIAWCVMKFCDWQDGRDRT